MEGLVKLSYDADAASPMEETTFHMDNPLIKIIIIGFDGVPSVERPAQLNPEKIPARDRLEIGTPTDNLSIRQADKFRVGSRMTSPIRPTFEMQHRVLSRFD